MTQRPSYGFRRRAGSGSEPSALRLFRLLILSTTAGCGLWFPGSTAALAACSGSGTITCTGDLSGGVSYTAGNTTLNVNSLTTNPGPIYLNGSGGNGDDGTGFIAVGGDGDDGGAGTTTTIVYSGSPYTLTSGGNGIVALSNGGNGGDGGNGVSVLLVPGFGGDGGEGGAGGTVWVTSTGNIATVGNNSNGILAQANGGNGGDGGNSTEVAGVYGEGGDGGKGGVGGAVHVTTLGGTIYTSGTSSAGIYAQSNGGVGGDGGSVNGLGIAGNGGDGAAPRDGGTVTINTAAAIETYGSGSYGVFAQSVGGFAGAGGGGGINVFAFGGSGASAGNGSTVSVTNSGAIHTRGSLAYGIFAQSVGGGGGAGGWSGGVLSLGGSGGAGGSGGNVSVTNTSTGAITTDGANAIGIFAQSIGGSGGDAGNSGGLISIGGSGDSGGSSGTVSVSNAGAITTNGAKAQGILAQSIGGGGGNGGVSGGLVSIGGSGGTGGSSGAVTVSNSGSITTHGADAQAIIAQSIGGGGGNGGISGGVVTIGGSSGGGGNGSTVTVNSSGSLETHGDRSTALFAQSVGGGGGNGGGAYSGSAFIGFSLGGAGGSGGISDKVTVNLSSDPNDPGSIVTHGVQSGGIVAQSIGGGGGNGGSSVQATVGYAGSLSIAIGGKAGGGGAGGEVALNGYADVTTYGDDSDGILAQSVGGGGGNGGYAVSVSLAGGETAAISGSIGVGGSGGSGGNGSTVTVNAGGDIHTHGARSEGLIAQSVGGGGGNGGFAVSVAGAGAGGLAGAIAVGVGGSGGTAGHGGTVNATFNGNVTTEGTDSDGVVIQSVGGGGGNGGFAVAGAIAGAGGGAGSVNVGVGGNGAGGGNGGTVSGTVNGDVTTWGDDSTGFLVQSVGGGGGNGGFAAGGSISGAGTGAGAVSVGVGGSGEGGGSGGDVTAKLNGDAETHGARSTAVLVQSLGGGGGNGGFNVSGSIAGAGTGAGSVAVGVGGSAGAGGSAGKVTADVIGDIDTYGYGSGGFTAQSLGGGGGNGGFNVTGNIAGSGTGAGSVAVGVGGAAGDGGSSGLVDASVTGDIWTRGDASTGYLAQSVGGGGGNGGFNVTGTLSGSGTGAGAVGVGVGGMGGGGGSAGAVIADQDGNITTEGVGSAGFVAQSIGGGGGNGAFNVTGALAGAGKGAGAVGVGVGGMGGDGGSASTVTASVKGNVTTEKARSQGILVQSVGGGGGNGAFNVTGALSAAGQGSGAVGVGVGGFGGGGGSAGNVSSTVEGDILTKGADSNGVTVQSLGGGGGNGGFNVTGAASFSQKLAGTAAVGVGGFGGDGGDAGTVNSSLKGDIETRGNDSTGLLVQSLGGGGGNGAFNVAAGLSGSLDNGGVLGVGIGGFGGGGGDGKAVTSTSEGDVTTKGSGAKGAVVQSLGGSGGNGGINVTGTLSLTGGKSGAIGVGIGGFGGGGGSASTVNGSLKGDVSTDGQDADGVLVQSVGGGGGNGGLNVTGSASISLDDGGALSFGLGGFGGDGGNSGDVDFSVTGDVTTHGKLADAVTIQSIGGGGGNGALNVSGSLALSLVGDTAGVALGIGGFGGGGGDAGNVKAKVKGIVNAEGGGTSQVVDGVEHVYDGSHGVVAQSIGGGGGNGGINISGAISADVAFGKSYSFSFGLGGFGGDGGDAGTVDLTVDSPTIIHAHGDYRSAVLAQSVGGGGGSGALNVSGGLTLDAQATVGIGGFGGGGGLGKDVTVSSTGKLEATGVQSRGLLAQSIGGGGGDGGINISGGVTMSADSEKPSLVFGLGGYGGAANKSGNVKVTQSGEIVVDGVDSYGILAQSVAGGGGAGGLNVSANGTLGKGYSAAIGIGGSGGTGADSGSVTLASDGKITVDTRVNIDPGDDDYDRVKADYGERGGGILAQSIGGGGGVGGINASGVLAPRGNPIVVGVGGSGGAGGNAGAVIVNRGLVSQALLETKGDEANGLTAQSIGGGGGNAGMNFGVSLSGIAGDEKPKQLFLTIGGSGGAAGNGNTVTVTQKGDIKTSGDRSDGILAQSVGGGGGNANLNVAGGINKNASGLNLAIGGGTGDGGTGAAVTVNHTGDISTKGIDSKAIFAQSIGGGGGNVATNMAISVASNNSLDIAIGRLGGTGGAAGEVTVTSDGTLSTKGDRSTGILAQSIGGGGGNSGSVSVGVTGTSGTGNDAKTASVGVAVGLEGGEGGIGGKVTVTSSGEVSTEGDRAHAIHAQSVGGGGGAGGGVINTIIRESASVRIGVGGKGGSGSTGGAVAVNNTANLFTKGSDATGITAESTGGGGGSGGYVLQVALAATGAAANGNGSLSVSVGGKGGTGASGGAVTVNNSGQIVTEGTNAHGINARSIGGGGGDGGLVFVGTLSFKSNSDSLDVAVGGAGGEGGTGGKVEVVNDGKIFTDEEGAAGIRAMSVGGGGGDAGLVANLTLTVPGGENSTHRVAINIGGSGGEGGTGGEVKVTNKPQSPGVGGYIETKGDKAYGIMAQSIGGGGGNGSSVVSMNIAAGGGENSVLAGLNIGGFGGDGNTGGKVSVYNSGTIITHGEEAHGVFAQSIGGGGGNGGMALAINGVLASKGTAPVVAIGGLGGNGGNGGDVLVDNSGSIVTFGKNANGILAQSIGGGGGNANIGVGIGGISTLIANPFAFAIGAGCTLAECYSGGTGGKVTINHSGTIAVEGEGAVGYKGESLNGGGGSMVIDFNGIASLPGGSQLPGASLLGLPEETDIPVVTLIAGGDRTENTTAGMVTINATGNTYVRGNYAYGALLQAIGGGGGNIQAKFDLNDEMGVDALGIVTQLGGTGGQNNNGGDINSILSGDFGLEGSGGGGVLLQSIGGGGGRANIVVQSSQGQIGGGTNVVLGGTGGTNEAGGNIDITQNGDIGTEGDGSFGSLVQSIGGGGGYASVTMIQKPQPLSMGFSEEDPVPPPMGMGSMAYVEDENAPAQSSFMAMLGLGTVSQTLGADGGSGLDGGTVTVNRTGDTMTDGDLAIGLTKQSIGAGGGFETASGFDVTDVTLGGTNGASGSGRSVSLTNTGLVQTLGNGSHGILLQSIGGGGGTSLTDSPTVNVTLRDDNTGDGGDVSLVQNGNIATFGETAFGVIAQSIGGGGGFAYNGAASFFGSAGGEGSGGKVSLTFNGSVYTEGDGSTAVLAQSDGQLSDEKTGDDISVTLAANEVIRGGKGGTGVALKGGKTNSVVNNGAILTKDLILGNAVTGTWGDDTIYNNLYMIGNVSLGGGLNGYNNAKTARYDMGATVDLGGGTNLFYNEGIVAPGETGKISTVATTALNGNLTQTIDGNYEVDLDFVAGNAVTGKADRINVSKQAALKGTVDLSIVNPTQAAPGYHEVTILHADDGVTDQSLALNAPASAVAKYQILYPTYEDVVLSYDIDFSAEGLNKNQTRFGNYVNRVQLKDSNTILAPIVGYIFSLPTLEDLSATYATLTPEIYSSHIATTLASVDDFGQALTGCRTRAEDLNVTVHGLCGWMRVSGRKTSYDQSFEYNAYDEDAVQLAGGVQKKVSQHVSAGFGMSYEDTDTHLKDLAQSDGNRFQAGGFLEGQYGGSTLAAALVLGYGTFDTQRGVALGDLGGIAKGRQDLGIVSGRLKAAHEFGHGPSFLRVGAEGAVTAIYQEDFRENGGGLGNLDVQDHTNLNASVMPFVELGSSLSLNGGGIVVQPWSKLGVLQYLSSDNSVYAGLVGGPDVDPFFAAAGFDKTFARVELGLDITAVGGATLRVNGVSMFSPDADIYQGNVKLSVPF